MPPSASPGSSPSTIITTTTPETKSLSEYNEDEPEDESTNEDGESLSSSANAVPGFQSHGSTPTACGGRHTRQNNSGDLISLYPFEGTFSPYQTVHKTTREAAQLEASKKKKVVKAKNTMSGRPRTARGATREAGKESDLEADLHARIVEGVKKAKEHNDESQRLGQEIMSLEGEIKAAGRKCF